MPVKTYSLKKDGKTFLSEHFRIREFRCKDGSDKIRIDTDLIKLLERVYSHFNCSKINISSGYRTPAHDKRVGGKGGGSHTLGKAADFTAYDSKGKKIPSREIALYLEDIGVRGIGYRSGGGSYSTHTDVNYRSKNWFGDEKRSFTASIGKSFYSYFKIKYTDYMAISNVSIRREPSLKSERIAILGIGSKIKVADCLRIKRDGYTWYKVLYDGMHCYIAGRYLKEALT